MTAHATSRPPRPPRRPRRRRLSAAGNVILTLLVALTVGWLLNAPGILKTAEGMPLGWQRDVAVGFAKPVASVSSFLQIDTPRRVIQNLTGRSGEDTIDVQLPSPTTAPATPDPTAPATTAPDIELVYTPEVPMRAWIGGDSLAITPGESLLPRLDGTGAATAVGPVDGRVATGLARPEIFNWPLHLEHVIATHDPDALVLTIGSNDDQALTNAPEGTVGGVGSPEWQDEYRRRVGGLMDLATRDGRQLFWVGIPIVRDTDRYARGYEIINRIVAEEAVARTNAHYVETFDALAIEGGYADFLPGPDGDLTQIRAGDGIHFTRAGGNIVADEIMEAVRETVDLDSWRDPPDDS